MKEFWHMIGFLVLVVVVIGFAMIVIFRLIQEDKPRDEEEIVAQRALEQIPNKRWPWVCGGAIVTGLLFLAASIGELMPGGHSWIMAPVSWCGRVGWIMIAVGIIGIIIGLRHEQKVVDRRCRSYDGECKECDPNHSAY